MVSRLTLALQYGTIIFHTRKYKASRLPLMLTVVLHFISAMIYLGIAFRFRDYNSQVYIAWYIIGIIELLLQSGMSLVWDVLTFRNTHLANRMSLLTLIIMGEGIIVIASNVTVVVKNPDAWSTYFLLCFLFARPRIEPEPAPPGLYHVHG
jgi:low temperature requirement protein LtrA